MGTTADKLSYLNTTKNYIKESINLTNINITNEPFRYYAYAIKKGIINVLNDPKEIWNNFEKVTGTGTTITLESTADAPMEIDLKGNTQQDSTPTPDYPQPIHNVSGDNTIEICGKNLAKSFYGDTSQQSAYQKAFYIDFDLKPSTTYTISFNGTNGDKYYVSENIFTTSPYFTITNERVVKTLTTKSEISSSQFFEGKGWAILKNQTGTTNANVFSDVQVEKGTTATEYEAYTGQSQLISLGVENLFDKNNITILNGYIDTNIIDTSAKAKTTYIACQPNTTYTIQKRNDGNNNRFTIATTSDTPALNVSVSQYNNNSAKTMTITTNSSAKYLCLTFYHTDETQVTEQEVLDSIQIEKGSKANSYSPYGASYIELCKIGNYQDYFYKTDKWYLHKEIGKVVLKGGEDETWILNQSGDWYRYRIKINEIISGYVRNEIKSNNFKYIVAGHQEWSGFTYGQQIYLIPEQTITTEEGFKTWLSTHNTIVYYILEEATNTEITDSTLIYQLEKTLYSYNGQTNISQTNNDLPFILDVTALEMIE